MSDRSILTNICVLGVLGFLVLSSGVLQCAYDCIEEDNSRRIVTAHNQHPAHVTNCHLILSEPVQSVNCPDRSCHQSQAPNRSLGGPEYSSHIDSPDPLLGGLRLPLPAFRSGQPLQLKPLPAPILLASWHPPTTPSQTMLGVRSTVLMN